MDTQYTAEWDFSEDRIRLLLIFCTFFAKSFNVEPLKEMLKHESVYINEEHLVLLAKYRLIQARKELNYLYWIIYAQ